jgi:predicted peptidase
MKQWACTMLALVAMVPVSAAAQVMAPASLEGTQTAMRFEAADGRALAYWLYLPQGYESREQWPLMLFLHGSGERGSDLERVKRHGPPKLIAAGRQYPFIVVSPQSPQSGGWEPDLLNLLLDDLQKTYRVDENRVYLTGLSMGGAGTWRLAASNPHRFAAIAPVCGRSNLEAAASLAHLPIWIFHGADDPTVPLSESEQMYAALKAAGAQHVGMTIYPDTPHDSWTATYDNPQIYDWLLKQRRRPGN